MCGIKAAVYAEEYMPCVVTSLYNIDSEIKWVKSKLRHVHQESPIAKTITPDYKKITGRWLCEDCINSSLKKRIGKKRNID